MKTVRQVAILDIIEKHDVETQEQLAEELGKRGIKVTQATVSRDIKFSASAKTDSERGIRPRFDEKISVIVMKWKY